MNSQFNVTEISKKLPFDTVSPKKRVSNYHYSMSSIIAHNTEFLRKFGQIYRNAYHVTHDIP